MRILVTGSTGVVGKRLVPLLLAEGHDVTAVARNPEQREDLIRRGARGIALDLFAPGAVRKAVDGHDVVINLATSIPSLKRMLFRSAWKHNDRLRSIASVHLAKAAETTGAERYIQESCAPIYETGADAWIGEDWPVRPSRYNRSVLDAERAAVDFTRAGGSGVVLRFSLFYGPDSDFIHSLVGGAQRGTMMLPGPAAGYVSSISHDDAAAATFAALKVPAGVYNVTDDEPVRRREFADALAAAAGAPPPKLPPEWITWLIGAPGEMLRRSLRISNRKLRESSSWTPASPSVREGFRTVVR